MNTILLDKSKDNLESAKLLNQEELFSSSVHCSYYSCLQNITHTMYYKVDGFDKDAYIDSVSNNDKSHLTLQSVLKKEMYKKKIKNDEIRCFNIDLGNLKRNRVNADYDELVINEETSLKSIKLAEKINSFLNEKFK